MKPVGSIAYKTAADIAAKASMLAVTLAAARRLPHVAFGELALASTIGWMLGVASDAGLQMHVARAIARAPGEAAAILRRWSTPKILLAAAAASIVVVLGLQEGSGELATGGALIALTYVVLAQLDFLHHVLRGLSRTDVESSVLIALRCATLVLALLVLWLRPRLDLVGLALLLPAVVALIVSGELVRRYAGSAPAVTGPPRGREFVWDVLPIGAGVVLSALYFRIDVLLVDRWLGVEAVALYSAVFRLVDALRLFPAAVLAVMLPSMCRARDLGTLVRVCTSMVLPAIALAAALGVAAPGLVSVLYGASYAPAAPALRVLALAVPLLALNYALTQQLIAWGGQLWFAAACGGALVANVSLNSVLIPSQGIAGAAWATVGTEVFLTGTCVAALVPLLSRRTVDIARGNSLGSRA